MVQAAARPADQPGDGGSRPTSPLKQLQVKPVPFKLAKAMLEKRHYLHSLPGGTCLTFGVFQGHRLLGALTLGVGPKNVHGLVGTGPSPKTA